MADICTSATLIAAVTCQTVNADPVLTGLELPAFLPTRDRAHGRTWATHGFGKWTWGVWYQDTSGNLKWRLLARTLTAARAEDSDALNVLGETMQNNPKLFRKLVDTFTGARCPCPCQEQGHQRVSDPTKRYINVYRVTRHCGGREEGRWWYNWLECIDTIAVDADASEEERARVVVLAQDKHADEIWGDIYSSTGGVDIDVYEEIAPAESETTSRPYYE